MAHGLMCGWECKVVYMKGAFPHGAVDDKMYMHVPEGFEKYYPERRIALILLKAIYGTKRASIQFWKEVLVFFMDMDFK